MTFAVPYRPRLAGLALAAAGLLALLIAPAWSTDNLDDVSARLASGSVGPYLAVGELSLLADGRQEAIQGAKAVAATCFVTEVLKFAVREKRPSGASLDSFPSGHTSAAFAMATVLNDYHPRYAWLNYAAAAAIGWSRAENHAHRWQDIAAGAIIGTVIAKQFAHRHITVSPDGVGWQTRW